MVEAGVLRSSPDGCMHGLPPGGGKGSCAYGNYRIYPRTHDGLRRYVPDHSPGQKAHGASPESGPTRCRFCARYTMAFPVHRMLGKAQGKALALTIGQISAGRAGNVIPEQGIYVREASGLIGRM